MIPSRIEATLLFLSADVTRRLNLDEEVREVTRKIRESDRDSLKLVYAPAARPDDLLLELNLHHPRIVHFSGHGNPEGIVFLNDRQQPKTVPAEVLRDTFRVMHGDIQVVVLNSCYSEVQADAIVEVVDCVVGMREKILDSTARKFSPAFYRALGFGVSVRDAFDQAKVAIMLEDIPGHDAPVLLVRNGVDADEIRPVEADPVLAGAEIGPAIQQAIHILATAEEAARALGQRAQDLHRRAATFDPVALTADAEAQRLLDDVTIYLQVHDQTEILNGLSHRLKVVVDELGLGAAAERVEPLLIKGGSLIDEILEKTEFQEIDTGIGKPTLVEIRKILKEGRWRDAPEEASNRLRAAANSFRSTPANVEWLDTTGQLAALQQQLLFVA